MQRPVISLAAAAKWMCLVAALWVQSFSGTTYLFSDFSSKLKTTLDYTQVQLNVLAIAKNFGSNVGILSGIVSNKLPAWTLILIGAGAQFLGFLVIWLVASEKILALPLWLISVLIFVASNGATWCTTAVLVTCIRNFSHTRGTVAGILKGSAGLSAAIFNQIFRSFLREDPLKLLLFLAIGPTLVVSALMGFIRPMNPATVDENQKDEHKKFILMYTLIIVLALYILAASLLIDLIPLTGTVALKIIATVTLLLLFSQVILPIKLSVEGFFANQRSDTDRHESSIASVDPLIEPLVRQKEGLSYPYSLEEEGKKAGDSSAEFGKPDENDTRLVKAVGSVKGERKPDPASLSQQDLEGVTELESPDYFETGIEESLAAAEGAFLIRKRRPRRGEDFKLRQALVKADYWLLFVSFFCGVGSALTAVDNLAQIGQAQGYSDVSLFVTIFSISDFLGRLWGGWLSEQFVRSAALPRTLWVTGAQAFMIVAHLLFASAIRGSLYGAPAILGICYGTIYSLMVPISSELFGLKHFGAIYNFLTLGCPVASLLFSGYLAGYFYDREAEKQNTQGLRYVRDSRGFFTSAWAAVAKETEDVSCTGSNCFKLTFLIMAAVCSVGTVLSLVLTYRVWPVYKTLYGSSYASLPPAVIDEEADSETGS